jgi:hypothetical protein
VSGECPTVPRPSEDSGPRRCRRRGRPPSSGRAGIARGAPPRTPRDEGDTAGRTPLGGRSPAIRGPSARTASARPLRAAAPPTPRSARRFRECAIHPYYGVKCARLIHTADPAARRAPWGAWIVPDQLQMRHAPVAQAHSGGGKCGAVGVQRRSHSTAIGSWRSGGLQRAASAVARAALWASVWSEIAVTTWATRCWSASFIVLC